MERGKRAHITHEGEKTIISRAVAYPRLKRATVAERLQNEFESKGWDIPEIEVLERKISKYRKTCKVDSEDQPWTLDALKDNPIPPDALGKVFQVWLQKQEIPWSPPLSNREVRWVVRFSAMTSDTELLRIVSELCAEWELIGRLTEIPQLSSPSIILHVYETITSKSIEKERRERILKDKEIIDRPERIEAELEQAYGKGIIRSLDKVKSGEKTLGELIMELHEKGAQNERINKAKE